MKSKWVLATLGGLFAATALADDSNVVESSVSDIFQFNTTNAVEGVAVAIRDSKEVTAHTSITGLTPGHAYTIWWAIFNKPRFCVMDGCGLDDLAPTADPRIGASLLWAGGFVAGADGSANVTSQVRRGRPPGEVRFGPGLKRRDAEIHIVLRTHGDAIPGMIAEQTRTFGGGCGPAPGFAGCANVFTSVHFRADGN